MKRLFTHLKNVWEKRREFNRSVKEHITIPQKPEDIQARVSLTINALIDNKIDIIKFYRTLRRVWHKFVLSKEYNNGLNDYYHDLTRAMQINFGHILGIEEKDIISKRETREEYNAKLEKWRLLLKEKAKHNLPNVYAFVEKEYNEALARKRELIDSGISKSDPRIVSLDSDIKYLEGQLIELKLSLRQRDLPTRIPLTPNKMD